MANDWFSATAATGNALTHHRANFECAFWQANIPDSQRANSARGKDAQPGILYADADAIISALTNRSGRERREREKQG
jgi:hypothetical protein